MNSDSKYFCRQGDPTGDVGKWFKLDEYRPKCILRTGKEQQEVEVKFNYFPSLFENSPGQKNKLQGIYMENGDEIVAHLIIDIEELYLELKKVFGNEL